ncbi:TauD/TfdA family dioxygenase [Streptomyces violaceusniger]|uniref:Syringomycin biosynthesis enzyme n=1 Tax=Streptomyces violaceusniger TaxID=68280 RepID=A0A4D4LMH6_STRVO|nr:syringomycin biosynthesis enzyme [Streptomyces violaceusniger]
MTTVDILDSITFEAGFPSMARQQGEAVGTVDLLANLTTEQRAATRDLLDTTGSVLFRGFGVRTVDDFERVAQGLLGELAPYRGGDAPRQAEKGFVYNAAGPSPSRLLRAHNELSYAPWHPTTLCFACGRPADEGGATTIIDGHRVYLSLPAEIRDAFRTKGVTYIQHLPNDSGDPSGIKSWPETFGTDSRENVMELCRSSYTSAEWTDLGLLTTNRTPGAVEVGSDHRMAWFNQAHIWRKDENVTPDVTNMDRWRTRFGYGAMFGDGTEIPAEYIEVVSQTLIDWTVPVNWEAGDVLLVDNRAVMHGRLPFCGPREVFVAFA